MEVDLLVAIAHGRVRKRPGRKEPRAVKKRAKNLLVPNETEKPKPGNNLQLNLVPLGAYPVQLDARNRQGAATLAFSIVVGDQLAPTPPMGWNSWYIHKRTARREMRLPR